MAEAILLPYITAKSTISLEPTVSRKKALFRGNPRVNYEKTIETPTRCKFGSASVQRKYQKI